MDGFGEEGQEKLSQARVLIVGVGGLGSAVSYYLAAAGIGSISLVDPDKVDVSNLNRQILHSEYDIGVLKIDSAFEKLSILNSEVALDCHPVKLDEDNALELCSGHDIIVDCLDNFASRYVLNKASLELGIPMFHGACQGLEGRVSVFVPGRTACFRCLYPRAPTDRVVPVIGAAAGVVGTLMAAEVVKYVVGIGEVLLNYLLLFDGEIMGIEKIELLVRTDCPDCHGRALGGAE